MTLEGVNALLRWVGAVVMGWHEFQFVFVFIHNNLLERLGKFIVHFVDSWTEAPLLQVAKISWYTWICSEIERFFIGRTIILFVSYM